MRRASWSAFLLAFAGCVLLAAGYDAFQPPLVAVRDLAQREGQEVRIDATVARSTALALGGQLAQLSDGTGRTAAWLRTGEPLAGARVEVRGIVERDRVGMQVRAVEVEVLRPATTPLPAEELARVLPALSGARVEASGQLTLQRTGSYVLASGDAAVPLLGLQPWQAAGLAGHDAVVRGLAQYDPARVRYVLDVSEVRPG